MVRLISLFLWSLWIGVGFGVTFVAIPVVFGPAIRNSLPPGQAGHVAQSILLRLFQCQIGFVALASILYWIERNRDSVAAGRLRAWLLPPLGAVSLLALFWLHPFLAGIHAERYDIHTPEIRRRELASRFGAWHGVSQMGNLFILIGTIGVWWNMAQRLRSAPTDKPVEKHPSNTVGS